MKILTAKHKILIVGSGPVGLSLAVELTRRNIPFRIIDQGSGPTPENESRALGVHLRTLDILTPSGIADTLRAKGNLITKIKMTRDGRQFAVLDLSKHPRKDSAILSIPQGTTERVFLAWLAQHGVVPQWNTTLIKLEMDADTSIAHIRSANGETEDQAYDYIIGCDGAHSIVRKSAGIDFSGRTGDEQWSLVDVEYINEIDPHTGRPNFLTGNGVIVAIPINKNLVRYFSSGSNVIKLIPDQENIRTIHWQSTFQISYRVVETFQKHSVYLAGDAAHIHSPAGGRGMNLGIEDAAWLAWLISEKRAAEYSNFRLPVAQKTIRETFALTDQITNETMLARLLRGTVLPLLLKIPPIRTRIFNNLLALDTPPPPWLK
ncbi:MAG: FAD-dependent monooxygenase [Robiginitomaculum sp.]|nr:FAD-dependent monooxygenase [Robiginitomaculum sp.]